MNSTEDVVRENRNEAKEIRYAPHIRRLAAAAIDGIILSLIGIGISRMLGLNPYQTTDKTTINYLDTLITLTVYFIYTIGFWVKRNGQTPGKQFMHLKIVQENNKPLDWFTAIIRYIAQLVSYVVLGLGYVWILFDARNQSWHDKIAKTLVIEADDQKPHGCVTALGCIVPVIFFLSMVGVGVYQGFTQAIAKRDKNQSVTSYQKALNEMNPEAKKHYDRSAELFKQMREASQDASTVRKLNDENIAALKKATEQDPTNARIWSELGSAYTWVSTNGTLQDGLKAYAKAEDLDPTNVVYIVNTADMLWRLGKFDDAILEVQKGLRINDNYAYGHFILARAYAGNKIYPSAREEFTKAIDIYKQANTSGQFDDEILMAQKEQAALPKE